MRRLEDTRDTAYKIGDVDSDTKVPNAKNIGRYSGSNNFGFADGHAKWMKFSQTLDRSKPATDTDNFGMHNADNRPPIEE